MHWLAFVAGAVLSWGVYGAMLHQGQVKLGNPMRALLCVGIAYFLMAVLVPLVVLASQGQGLRGFTTSGATAATVAGALGALGAVCIIFSFRTGGTPTYVMPLVFGGAPLVNVLYTMDIHPPKIAPNPLLYIGFLVTAIGAGMVLYFKPQVAAAKACSPLDDLTSVAAALHGRLSLRTEHGSRAESVAPRSRCC